MILRRLAEGVRQQDWFTVVVEVLIVVVGIIIGLQVDDWNEARKERAEERLLLERIRDDLLLDIGTLDLRTAFWAEVYEYGTQVLRYAESGKRGEATDWDLILAYYQASQIWPYSTHDTAYEEVRGAGQLGLISSLDLRTTLARYYAGPANEFFLWDVQPAYRIHVRRVTPFVVQYYIWNNCISVSAEVQEFYDCPSAVGESEAESIITALSNNSELVLDLRMWMTDSLIVIAVGKERRENARAMAASIEALLSDK